MAFKEIKVQFWVPEKVGESITGHVVKFFNAETVHGLAVYAVVRDVETDEDYNAVIGGGLLQLRNQGGKLVRITYEGEGVNPNAKKGRNQKFKKFKLEVDDEAPMVDYEDLTVDADPFK